MVLDLPSLQTEATPYGRFYVSSDGQIRYPSVTTVLGATSKGDIQKWVKAVGQEQADKILHQACYRGSALHELVEHFLLGNEVDYRRTNPIVLSYFIPIRKWLEQNIEEVVCLEAALYSDRLRVAGRVDLVCKYRGKLTVVDFKTAFREKKESSIGDYYLQASAYAVMFAEQTGLTIKDFVILMANEKSRDPQIFHGKVKDHVRDFYLRRLQFPDV